MSNENISLYKKYPLFNKEFSLTLFPNRVEVFNEDRFLIVSGNESLGILLQNCDGSKTLTKIVQENTETQKDFVASLEGMVPLIEELLTKKVINLVDNQIQIEIKKEKKSTIVPYVVSVELTNQCNLECSYCYQNSSPRLNRILREPLNIFQFLRDCGVHGVELTGGEPLMHPNFKEILSYCCKNFLMCSLITNGMLLNKTHLEILKRGKAIPSIQICLNGPDKETVDSTSHIVGSFGKILEAIKTVKKHNLLLRVGMIIDDPNKIKKLENTLLLAKKMGADNFIATPVFNFGRAKSNSFLLKKNVMKSFSETHQYLKEKYGDFYSRESELLINSESINCGAGWRTISINWTGSVKLCPLQPLEWLKFGEILHLKTPNLQKKMKACAELKPPGFKFCEGCEYILYCMNCLLRPINLIKQHNLNPESCKWFQANLGTLKNQLLMSS